MKEGDNVLDDREASGARFAEPEGAGIHEALGQSEAFVAFQEQLSRVAGVDRPVLKSFLRVDV